AVTGYEIHNGVTRGPALQRPLFDVGGRLDGAVSDDGQVMGGYLHGLFDRAGACDALLKPSQAAAVDYQQHRQTDLDRLADSVEQHLDLTALRHYLQDFLPT